MEAKKGNSLTCNSIFITGVFFRQYPYCLFCLTLYHSCASSGYWQRTLPQSRGRACGTSSTCSLPGSLLMLKSAGLCVAPVTIPTFLCSDSRGWCCPLTKPVPYFAGCCWGSPTTVSTSWWWTSTAWTRSATLSQQHQLSSLPWLTNSPWEKMRWNCKQKLVSHVPNLAFQGLQLSVHFFFF